MTLFSDFVEVSRMLTFDSGQRSAAVFVQVINDNEREVTNETVNVQLSFVEEIGENSVLLLPNRTLVTIVDDDG